MSRSIRVLLALLALSLTTAAAPWPGLAGQPPHVFHADAYRSVDDAGPQPAPVHPGDILTELVLADRAATLPTTLTITLSYDALRLRPGPIATYPRTACQTPAPGTIRCSGTLTADQPALAYTATFTVLARGGDVAPFVALVDSGGYRVRIVSEVTAVDYQGFLPVVAR